MLEGIVDPFGKTRLLVTVAGVKTGKGEGAPTGGKVAPLAELIRGTVPATAVPIGKGEGAPTGGKVAPLAGLADKSILVIACVKGVGVIVAPPTEIVVKFDPTVVGVTN